jgi:hypothetical protein
MAVNKSNELEQRREDLMRSLPALSQKRADTYRLNSDAVALDRAGVKTQAPQAIAQLGEDQAAADLAIRDCQQELRDVDAEIERMPRRSFGARLARAISRDRGDR